eukprot:jgi/Mesen1/7078/ME000369S06399
MDAPANHQQQMKQAATIREVHDKVADIICMLANEPSVGLYYVQQHTQRAVPAVVALKTEVADTTQVAKFALEDVKEATGVVRAMKEKGSPVLRQMLRTLEHSTPLLPNLRPGYGTLQPVLREEVEVDEGKILSSSDVPGATQGEPVLSASVGALKATMPALSGQKSSKQYLLSVLDYGVQKVSSFGRGSDPSAHADASNASTSDSYDSSAKEKTPGQTEPNVRKESRQSSYMRAVFDSALETASQVGSNVKSVKSKDALSRESLALIGQSSSKKSPSTLFRFEEQDRANIDLGSDTAFGHTREGNHQIQAAIDGGGGDQMELVQSPSKIEEVLQQEQKKKFESWLCEDEEDAS